MFQRSFPYLRRLAVGKKVSNPENYFVQHFIQHSRLCLSASSSLAAPAPLLAIMAQGRQSTLKKFAGGTASKAKTQSTLSFNGKANGKASEALPDDEETEQHNSDVETKEVKTNGKSNGKRTVHMSSDEEDKSMNKRSSPPEENESDDDVKPVSKKRKILPHPTTASKDNSKGSSNKGANAANTKEDIIDSDADDLPSEVEEKHVDKKKVAKVRAAIQSTGKDPYTDWKAGDPVPYAALCTTFSRIELTTKRLEITAYCSQFLQQVLRLTPNDLLPTVQLMLNKLAADYAGIELGIGESLIMKAIGESSGRSLKVIKDDHREIGDLGLVAAKSKSKQGQMFKPKPLTVRGVHEGLLTIAKMEGHGSQDQKVKAINKLLASADVSATDKKIDINKDKGGPSEAKFIVRFLEGKLRLGLAEKTVIIALSQAVVTHEQAQKGKPVSTEQLTKGEAALKQVYSELPSYEVIIPAMLEHGIMNVHDSCKLQPGVPLKPMLAKPTKSITEVLDRFEGKDFTCEYKYDGERAQIHYVAPEEQSSFPAAKETLNKDPKAFKGLAAVFSRNSEDLSKKYPDILEKLNTWIKPETKSFVLDCEAVAWDPKTKKVLPFQQLMTRKRKDVKTSDITVKVCIFAFDMLFLNGEALVKKSLRERRDLLHSALQPVEGELTFAQYVDTRDVEEIQTALDDSVKASCEGLMVKMLDTDESGYEPSKRSRNWLKVKKDYLAGVGDSIDLVVVGAYFGKGKRTNWYGAFMLACYNSKTQNFETVCNIGTGFSEAILEELHEQLTEIVIEKPKPFYNHSSVAAHQPDVWFEPKYVWEVKTADLTLSPRYRAAMDLMGQGISLRFPRFIQRRDDKKPEDATSSSSIVEMYKAQEVVNKDNAAKGGIDDDFEY